MPSEHVQELIDDLRRTNTFGRKRTVALTLKVDAQFYHNLTAMARFFGIPRMRLGVNLLEAAYMDARDALPDQPIGDALPPQLRATIKPHDSDDPDEIPFDWIEREGYYTFTQEYGYVADRPSASPGQDEEVVD